MITYEWVAERLDAHPQQDGFSNVVSVVYWRCNAVDGDYVATATGQQNIDLEPEGPFTPYNQLDQAQVLGWVKTALNPKGVADIQNSLAQQIATQKTPPVVSPALPWGN